MSKHPIVHIEIPSQDLAQSVKFYNALFDWKMDPCRSSSRRRSPALVMLPLCATAIRPLLQATENGCALSSAVSPAVE